MEYNFVVLWYDGDGGVLYNETYNQINEANNQINKARLVL